MRKEVSVIRCTRCETPISAEIINTSALVPCSTCKEPIRADVYPALYRRPAQGSIGSPLQAETEAGCFYHPGKKATVACSVCGRFLCALCDVDFNGRHLCPGCLEKGKTKRKIKNLENHRVRYDKIALFIAIFSMLLIWPTLITAPIVLFMVIRYWRAPGSIIPRSKVQFILAFAISGLQITGWILFFGSLLTS
jgi:hypothetical protein